MKNLLYAIKFQFYIINNFNLNVFYTIRFWIRVLLKRYDINYYSTKYKKGWDITFDEEFDSPEIDWTKWNKWWSENGNDPEKHAGENSLDCLVLGADGLTIKVDKNDNPNDDTYPLKTGCLFSSYVEIWENGVKKTKGFQQMFGYFEARCKPPKQGKLFWPAFWLWNNTWPPEIDVFEFMSEKDIGKDYTKGISFTTHWGYDGKKHSNKFFGNQLGKSFRKLLFLSTPKWDTHFHVYACEWTPHKIKWYIDDVCVYQHIYNIPTTEMGVLVSCGPPRGVNPKDEDLPANFVIDNIRVYKKSE